MERRVVVIDRDGVINRDLGRHVLSWEEFEFLPGALDAIARLTERGFLLSVASNQSAVEAGTLPMETLAQIDRRMRAEIVNAGGLITSSHYCPHTPFSHCMCRKPRPGLLLDVARRHTVEPQSLIMVGDSLRDIEAAHAIGARGVLVASGKPLPANSVSDGYGNSWVQVGNTKAQTAPVYKDLEEFALCLM